MLRFYLIFIPAYRNQHKERELRETQLGFLFSVAGLQFDLEKLLNPLNMGERKVLNKFYPSDFDPAKIPRRRQPMNQQMKVRMMLPFSIRCNKCANYIHKGTKFNSFKEDAIGLKYLGIQIFRFYFKCPMCSSEITIKTDPQNSDYTVDSGATRNYEHEHEAKKLQKREEYDDAVKSKRQMDIETAVDELKSMKSRRKTVSIDGMIADLNRAADEKEKKLQEEDEALVKLYFGKQRKIVRKVDDADLEGDDRLRYSKRSKY